MTLLEAREFKPSPYAFFCMGNEPKTIKKTILINDVEKEVCFYFGLDAETLHVPNRSRNNVKARQIICYLSTKLTRLSLKDIGRYFEQDHTTVIHACKTVRNLMDTEDEYKADVEYLLNLFNK